MAKASEATIVEEVKGVLQLEGQLSQLETELSQNEDFKKFIEFQKEVRDKSAEVFKKIEQTMIDNDIKSVKGDWGSLTIVERKSWTYDVEVLPKKFIKKVVDTTKVDTAYKLEGTPPKGATFVTKKGLMKRFSKS